MTSNTKTYPFQGKPFSLNAEFITSLTSSKRGRRIGPGTEILFSLPRNVLTLFRLMLRLSENVASISFYLIRPWLLFLLIGVANDS